MLARIAAVASFAFFVLFTVASRSLAEQASGASVSEQCLDCICLGVSQCNRTKTCRGDMFGISFPYWVDCGKPVIAKDNPDAEDAYIRCIINADCASRCVKQYMTNFAKDCNGDNAINCDDYARIHRLGLDKCQRDLDIHFEKPYSACKTTVQKNGLL